MVYEHLDLLFVSLFPLFLVLILMLTGLEIWMIDVLLEVLLSSLVLILYPGVLENNLQFFVPILELNIKL
jgi:hypothetical protein